MMFCCVVPVLDIDIAHDADSARDPLPFLNESHPSIFLFLPSSCSSSPIFLPLPVEEDEVLGGYLDVDHRDVSQEVHLSELDTILDKQLKDNPFLSYNVYTLVQIIRL